MDDAGSDTGDTGATGAADDPFAVIDLEVDLVRALLRAQHPDLAALPLELVGQGWDNAMFRLGDDLAVRLPIRGLCAHLVQHEQRWLPELAPRLPLPTPAPVRTGTPSPDLGYPWAWSIVPWLPGDAWLHEPPADLDAAAGALGRFVAALGTPAPEEAPPNPYRGVPLADRTPMLVEHLGRLRPDATDHAEALPDRATIERCWVDHVAVPAHDGPPCWVHGDLHPLNLLVRDGRLAAVIDFGDLTAGDPANDLMPAWLLFDGSARQRFLDIADPEHDPDRRRRGRGWALAWSVACGANLAPHNQLGPFGRRGVARVVDDWHRSP